ncbi:hypothetical protein A4X03_0g9484, partial [Tilletia caries]
TEGTKRGTIRFDLKPAANIMPLQVGNFAGGRGVVSKVNSEGTLIVSLDSFQVGVEGPRAASMSKNDREEMWRSALLGRDSKPGPGTTSEAPREVNPLTSFCETSHRFVLKSAINNEVAGRAYSLDGETHDVRLAWNYGHTPPAEIIYGITGPLTFEELALRIDVNEGRFEARHGDKTDPAYLINQSLSLQWRVRGVGRVVETSAGFFSLEIVSETNGKVTVFMMDVRIPIDNKRWAKYRTVPVGSFVGVRGTVETIKYNDIAKIVITLEHLCSPPPNRSGGPGGPSPPNSAETSSSIQTRYMNTLGITTADPSAGSSSGAGTSIAAPSPPKLTLESGRSVPPEIAATSAFTAPTQYIGDAAHHPASRQNIELNVNAEETSGQNFVLLAQQITRQPADLGLAAGSAERSSAAAAA